jgi:hypothetical protein
MEIKQFQDSRNSQLADFQKQYDYLKGQYSSTLLSAIQETDPQRQQELVQQILSINTELSTEVRGILTELNKGSPGFDPKTLEDLTNDLIRYQKQYDEIKKGKDKLQTLKMIYNTTEEKRQNITTMYNLYLGGLILLAFVIVFLIIRTSWVTTISDVVTSTVQTITPAQ